MDFKDKIVAIVRQALRPDFVRLEDDDGVSGFVVSRSFNGIPALHRQEMIDEILRKASLRVDERRRILMIAGLTPEEYDAVGARIRVHRVREMEGGGVEIVLNGALSDAEYVRGTLNNKKGVETSEPKPVGGASGELMSFRAKGPESHPLTKEKTIRMLKKDQHIDVMSNA